MLVLNLLEMSVDLKWIYLIVPVVAWDVLTRPDYVVFVGCLFLAIVAQKGIERRVMVKIFGLFVLAGVLTIATFFLLNGGFDNFTKINYLLDSPMWRRPPRALFGVMIMLTPIGFLASAYILYSKRSEVFGIIKTLLEQSLMVRLFVISVFLGLGRYFLQPDKLEFIFWEFTLFLFILSFVPVKKTLIALITVPIALSSFLTIALFERNFENYELKFSPSIQYGAFIQKSEKRKWNIYREESNFDKIVIKSVTSDFPECKSATFGYLDEGYDCLITDKWSMHQVLGLTATSGSKADKFKYVLISELPVEGWRGFRVSQPWEDFGKTREYFERHKSLPFEKYTPKFRD